jgi:integrase
MTKLLTDRSVQSARAGSVRREISDGGTGLYLVVQPSGAKSWALRYRYGGTPKKLTLGRYPLFGLKDARDKARAAKDKLDHGIDPVTEKAEAKAREPDVVRNVGATFVERYCRPRLRTSGEIERMLELHVYPKIGDRDIKTIGRRDILDVLDAMAAGGATVRCNRVLAAMRRLFGWAVDRDILAVSPVAGVKAPAPESARDRVLTDEELRAFQRGCDRLGDPFGRMFKVLLYTAARRDEVASISWGELDLKEALWTLPGERTKNGRSVEIPLSDSAVAVIKGLSGKAKSNGLLFPSQRTPGRSASGFGRAKARLDRLMLEELHKDAERRGDDPEEVRLAAWRLHDLRRTAASGMARLGVGIHVVERLLNHVSGSTTGGIVAVYQRHDFRDEKRAAVRAWGRFLDDLAGDQGSSNVVPIRAAGSAAAPT